MNLVRLFKSDTEEEQVLSTLVDPFKKDKVENIFLWIRKNWSGKIEFTAKVEFVNGPTKGEHNIKADDFPSLVKLVESFLKQL